MALVALSASCVKAPELIDIVDLGCEVPDVVAQADAGECSFHILSSGECTVSDHIYTYIYLQEFSAIHREQSSPGILVLSRFKGTQESGL